MIATIISFVLDFKKWVKYFPLIAVLVMLFLGYRHYKNTVDELIEQKNKNDILDLAVSTQADTIGDLKQNIKDWTTSQKDLTESINKMVKANYDAQQETRRLNETFAKHNLDALAIKHPKAIQAIINNGSNNAMRMLSCASGSTDPNCSDQIGQADIKAVAQPATHTNITHKMGSNY